MLGMCLKVILKVMRSFSQQQQTWEQISTNLIYTFFFADTVAFHPVFSSMSQELTSLEIKIYFLRLFTKHCLLKFLYHSSIGTTFRITHIHTHIMELFLVYYCNIKYRSASYFYTLLSPCHLGNS